MRIIVINQRVDLEELSRKVLKSSGETGKAALERVKAMNPHVDFQEIKPGTVMLLPDLAGLDASDAKTVGGDPFDGFASDIDNGCKAALARVRRNLEELNAEHTAIQAVLKTDLVARASAGDPLLKEQIGTVAKRFEAERKAAQGAVEAVELIQKSAAEGLAVLRKFLR